MHRFTAANLILLTGILLIVGASQVTLPYAAPLMVVTGGIIAQFGAASIVGQRLAHQAAATNPVQSPRRVRGRWN